MLKWILIVAGGLAGLLALVALIGAFLPVGHRAARTISLAAPPERVFETITAVTKYPEWRPNVKSVEVLPDSDGVFRFTEVGSDGRVRYRVEERTAPHRLVTRIDDPALPYGGSWTFELRAEPGGTALTITEDGEVYNVIFRTLSRTVFKPTATIEKYQAALARRISGSAATAN